MTDKLKIAVDTEYDEVTKIPFIVTMSDGVTSVLLYPDRPRDHFIIKSIVGSPDYIKIFHSATSDMYALHMAGIRVNPPYECTFIMSSLVNENFISRRLKDLAKKYLNEPCEEYEELKKIKTKYKKKLGNDFRWSKIPKEVIEPYAVKDAEYTIALFNYFQKKMPPFEKIYREIELPLIPIIVDMEIRGHLIDRNFCYQEMSRLSELYRFYHSKFTHEHGSLINLGSPKQIQSVIKQSGVEITEFTEKGDIATGKHVLEPLRENHPVFRYLLNCRVSSKQINTYYAPLLEEFTDPSDPVGHFSFYQSGTKSGRFSAELVQLVPKEKEQDTDITNYVRRAFIPRPGCIILYPDYDQIEMRLFAHFTKNQRFLQAIRDGLDAHEATAIDLWGDEYYKNPTKFRKMAKTINFGIIYGMGTELLAQTLGISSTEAHMVLSKYDQKYRIKQYTKGEISDLYRLGYMYVDWIGRKYHVPKDMAYKCPNLRIQGSAAYVIKLAMLRLADEFEGQPIRMLMQIHDELAIEVHTSVLSEALVCRIRDLMEDHTTFDVPLTVSMEYTETSWGEKKAWRFVE